MVTRTSRQSMSLPAATLSTSDAVQAKENNILAEQSFNTPAPQAPSEAMYSDSKIQVGQKSLEKLLELLRQMGFNKRVQDLSNQELSQVLEMADLPKALKAELSRDLPKLRQALVEVDVAIQKAQNGQIDWSSAGASTAASIVLEKKQDEEALKDSMEAHFEVLQNFTSPNPTYAPKPYEPFQIIKTNNQVASYDHDQSAEAAALVENALGKLLPEAAAQIDAGQVRAAGIGEAAKGVKPEGMSPGSTFSAPLATAKMLDHKNDETLTPFTPQH